MTKEYFIAADEVKKTISACYDFVKRPLVIGSIIVLSCYLTYLDKKMLNDSSKRVDSAIESLVDANEPNSME